MWKNLLKALGALIQAGETNHGWSNHVHSAMCRNSSRIAHIWKREEKMISIYKKRFLYYKCSISAIFLADVVRIFYLIWIVCYFSLNLHRNVRWNFCPCFKKWQLIFPILLFSNISFRSYIHYEFSLMQEGNMGNFSTSSLHL